jgi:hypothetical protein
MKQNHLATGLFTLAFTTFSIFSSKGQEAFHKGSFQINLSEGSTHSIYSTSDVNTYNTGFAENIEGTRDPLSLEYGISNHWGIGLSLGSDFFNVNPNTAYGFQTPCGNIKAGTSEFTIDGSYHFAESAKRDLAFVTSFGTCNISFKGGAGDQTYQYQANGAVIRLGLHARFYVLKHLGVLAEASVYSESASPEGVKGNTVANNYTTSICGFALEGGLCYRFKL